MQITAPLLQFQSQLKVWHWMTKSFAQHQAFGDAYEALSDSVDEFVETYFGRYGREPLAGIVVSLKTTVDASTVAAVIAEFKVYLGGLTGELREATDLLNMRDDILGEVDHLLYRLSLA
jgi:DNA-binding ferritin-like protein